MSLFEDRQKIGNHQISKNYQSWNTVSVLVRMHVT